MRTILAALVFVSGAAFAQQQPEEIYQRLHRAMLAGSNDEAISYATTARKNELRNAPGKEAIFKMMASTMPKAYVVNSRVFNPDGKTARLIASGMGEFMGQHSMMYGTVNFVREEGQWRVDQWEWGNQKPAAFPASAAAPAAAKPAAAAVTPAEQAASAPKEMSRLERQEARKKAREEAEAKRVAMLKEKEEADRKAFEERWKHCVIKPVMSDDDLRKCGANIKAQ